MMENKVMTLAWDLVRFGMDWIEPYAYLEIKDAESEAIKIHDDILAGGARHYIEFLNDEDYYCTEGEEEWFREDIVRRLEEVEKELEV